MIDIDIKDKIRKVSFEQYNDSLRFFKPKFTQELIGKDAVKHIQSRIDESLHYPHSLMLFCYLNDIYEHPKCLCGNHNKFNSSKKQFSKYCSNKCRFDNKEETIKQRRESNLKKYGHINALGSEEIKLKIIKTNLEKYGVDNYTKTDQYKSSVIGNKDSPQVKENKRQGSLKKSYNELIKNFKHCKPLFSLDEYNGVKGYIQYPWSCNTCGSNFMSSCDNGSSPVCNHCEPIGTKHEIICKQLLDSLGVDYKFRYRGMASGKEIDIFIPDKMFGVELCGLYWHSTANNKYLKPNHITKLEECETNGIKLFTVYDDEMYNPIKKRIVINKIKNTIINTKRKIYARKCNIIELSPEVCNKFMDKYHIQGSIGSTYKYGLLYRGRLVSVMTFNRGRTATGHTAKKGVWELGRYCTIFNFSIIGGASKLLAYFIKNINPSKIYSYADRRWSRGDMYEKIGFTFVKNTIPNYWYTKTFKTREHRVKYQKHKLINFPSYDKNLTESEIMEKEKYFKTWDCGSKLYVWNNPTKLTK